MTKSRDELNRNIGRGVAKRNSEELERAMTNEAQGQGARWRSLILLGDYEYVALSEAEDALTAAQADAERLVTAFMGRIKPPGQVEWLITCGACGRRWPESTPADHSESCAVALHAALTPTEDAKYPPLGFEPEDYPVVPTEEAK